MDTKNYPDVAHSQDVFQWDGFKNLATRLGIDLETPCLSITIELKVGDMVRITQKTYGVDCLTESDIPP